GRGISVASWGAPQNGGVHPTTSSSGRVVRHSKIERTTSARRSKAAVSACSKLRNYSITSSARRSSTGGMARPMAFAVLRLRVISASKAAIRANIVLRHVVPEPPLPHGGEIDPLPAIQRALDRRQRILQAGRTVEEQHLLVAADTPVGEAL